MAPRNRVSLVIAVLTVTAVWAAPPQGTLPPECASISCIAPSGCGVLDDGTVGCIPLTTNERRCKPDVNPKCICTEESNPTPCCKAGYACVAVNPCTSSVCVFPRRVAFVDWNSTDALA
jgi:hypothetical protein